MNIRKEIYPENEPIIAASLTMIGNDYSEAAKDDPNYNFEDARKYFEEALKIRKTTLGENHPDTAWSYHSIGKWYFYQKDYKKALEHFQKCQEQAENYLKKAYEIQIALRKTRAAEKTRGLLEQLK